jgi:Fe-S-cluster-containing dehydrogenase component/DMSO reductase anchor subunit
MTLLSAVDAVGTDQPTPIDQWLAAQSDLSAVERFSQRHDGELGHRQARYYRDLLPAAPPGPGQQYAFDVDLDACTGCKACVAACHSLNGLDEGESWRSVTLLTGVRGKTRRPFQQTVTAACHHCVDPACLKGCPVDAYEKDPVTGIVAHLDDQCIGCSYCTLTCPYEVPVYNHRRGIVRKCDLCTGRLAAGEAPACVQACPNGAIAITVVDTADAVARATSPLTPGAPPSSITVPTTRYRSARDAVASSEAPAAVGPAHDHPPLAVMLVLTQLSIGAFVTDLQLRTLTDRGTGVLPALDAFVIAAAGVLALAASVLHLGRPRYGYRAVVGLRHSWLSREVVAFGAFTGLAVPYALLVGLGPFADARFAGPALGAVVALSGILGVACSVCIYTTTHRSSWRPAPVTAKFGLTAAAAGIATVVWATNVSSAVRGGDGLGGVERTLLLALAAVVAVKLAGEATVLRHLVRGGDPEGARRAHLLLHDLRAVAARRVLLGVGAGVLVPLAWVAVGDGLAAGWGLLVSSVVLAGVVGGELAERSLFFTAASAPR